MNYTISILRRAQKELGELPVEAYERIRDSILALAEDPRPSGCVKLTIIVKGGAFELEVIE